MTTGATGNTVVCAAVVLVVVVLMLKIAAVAVDRGKVVVKDKEVVGGFVEAADANVTRTPPCAPALVELAAEEVDVKAPLCW